MTKEERLELSKLYVQQRDSQLKQLMAINGQGLFTILGSVGGLIFGGLFIKDSNIEVNINVYLLVAIGLGLVLLMAAAALFSINYNKKIKYFERLIITPKELSELDEKSFSIKLNSLGNVFVFLGIALILLGAFGIVIDILFNK